MYDEYGVFIPITEWKCFKEVATVLGEAAAYAELYKVFSYILTGKIVNSAITLESLHLATDNLVDAFVWDNTPQGGTFWRNINKSYKAKSQNK